MDIQAAMDLSTTWTVAQDLHEIQSLLKNSLASHKIV